MVMSASEWNSLMNRLPPEDRESYDSYLAAQEPIIQDPSLDESYWTVQVGDTGKTQAQLDAYQNAIDTMNMINADQPGTVTMDPVTGYLTYTPYSPPSPYSSPEPTPTTPTTPKTPFQPPYFPSTPYVPPYVPPYVAPYIAPKVATPQYVTFQNDKVPVNTMVDLLFEDIGGQELLSIVRSDTVNGQKIAYQPIKNLGILQEEYNPTNLIRLQNTSDKFFANYTIKLSDKIPVVGTGPNGETVYLNTEQLNIDNRTNIEAGALVIELVNLAQDEQVEIQITLNGTIYEAGI